MPIRQLAVAKIGVQLNCAYKSGRWRVAVDRRIITSGPIRPDPGRNAALAAAVHPTVPRKRPLALISINAVGGDLLGAIRLVSVQDGQPHRPFSWRGPFNPMLSVRRDIDPVPS
jgi:hypothetical protein